MTARFATILADPPWRTHSGRKPMAYAMMSVDAIASLPVGDIAAPDAHLYLWTINAHLEAAFGVVRSWGFRYSTTLVWAKAPMGSPNGETFGINTEFLLFARRGRLVAVNKHNGTWFNWKRRYDERGKPKHSAKPEEVYALVEHVSPGPYVELFSREKQPRMGWSYFGDESLQTLPILDGRQHAEYPR